MVIKAKYADHKEAKKKDCSSSQECFNELSRCVRIEMLDSKMEFE